MNQARPTNASMISRLMGVRLAAKVRKSRWAALPIRILGGSPIRVAVPPILEARISAIRNGTGLSWRLAATNRVTGATSTTIVTLSSRAELSAVTRDRMARIANGRPRPSRTDCTAIH